MLDPLAPIKITIIDPDATNTGVDVEAMAAIKTPDGKSQLQAYASTRDEKLIIPKTGMQAVMATIEPIGGLYQALVIDPKPSEPERRVHAFMAACREIDFGDGKPLAPEKLIQQRHGQEMADDEFFERARRRIGLKGIYEIGQVAIQRGQLGEDVKGVFRWSRI